MSRRMSRHAVLTTARVAVLTLAVCSSACVQTQDRMNTAQQHKPSPTCAPSPRLAIPTAQFTLGEFYTAGQGVPQDDAEAVAWYRRAAEQGDADAQFQLGVGVRRWSRRHAG